MSQQPTLPSKPISHLPLNHFNDEMAAAAYAESERDAVAGMSDDAFSTPKATGQSSPSSTDSNTAIPLAAAITQLRSIRARFTATYDRLLSFEINVHLISYVEDDEDMELTTLELGEQLTARYRAATYMLGELVEMEEGR
ncbi:hypothetical protein F5144DRAFT_565032 [Chaetomium tenue]|uniref:Uncharacterized protein n=1 Tax=Chaetomium tenue TaxID=1854479 RepID=A0ACB7PJS9_9PEZI|nr:hypothetical protein F5144DRAFT_565032 [Chaetomium globosum]